MPLEPKIDPTLYVTTLSPIHKLDRDILWYIFSLNADMFRDDKALTTTWITSWVCEAWRNILLQSPSIWGKLIDLDKILSISTSSSITCIKEMIRRTGNSLLWIKQLRFMPVFPRELEDLISLLNKHWTRIENLSVRMSIRCLNAATFTRSPDAWQALFSVAPNLRCIIFDVDGADLPPSTAAKPFFGNTAPQLRFFQIPCVHFDVNSTGWLRGLCSLHVGFPISLADTLLALTMAPQLEYLCVKDEGNFGRVARFHEPGLDRSFRTPVRLPDLKELKLCLPFYVSHNLLEHIEFPHSCSIYFSSSAFPAHSLREKELSSLYAAIERLSNHADLQFQSHSHPPNIVTLQCSNIYFKLNASSKGLASQPHFQVTISLWNSVPPHVVQFVLNHFSMGSLKRYVNISELHLTLLDPMTTETFNPVHHFLSTLPSVRVLRSTGSTLDLLTRIQRQSLGDSTLLPSLTTLSLLQPSYFSGGWNKTVGAFIRSRHKSGHPLEVIDLTDWGDIRHFAKLHGVPEMKILYRKKDSKERYEYVCEHGL